MWDLPGPGLEPVSPALAGGFFFFYLKIYLFIYFWLRWLFVAVRGLSPAAASGGHSPLQCAGLSLQWPLLVAEHGL